jgi:hypothetical protein
VQFLEFAKQGPNGPTFAAGITSAPKSNAEFTEDWRHIGAALIQWTKRRGSSAKTVMLTVVSDPTLHQSAKALIQRIYTEEVSLSPLLKALDVTVVLSNVRGQPVEEYRLGV